MSDILKQAYIAAGRAQDYFEDRTPNYDLWRAQTIEDENNNIFFLQPRLGDDGGPVDVQTEIINGIRFVKGCYAVKGKGHTGISTFDKPVEPTPAHKVKYRIPSGVEIPENLAVTRDNFSGRFGATHHTIAPKNDMTLELFIQSLKGLKAQKEKLKE